MNPVPVPPEARIDRPDCSHARMGPPPGVSDDDCGTVEMLLEPVTTLHPGGIPRGQYAYFQPSAEELEQLQAGGYIEVAQYGLSVQPFGARIVPPVHATPSLRVVRDEPQA